MDSLKAAGQLASAGRFAEALRALDSGPAGPGERIAYDVLKAELLERVGQHGRSRVLAEQLLKSRNLTLRERSTCEFVIGRVDWEAGNTLASIQRLQRSVSIALESGNLERACWSQLRLLEALADRSGPEATGPLLAEVRVSVTKVGHPHLTAALHLVVGEIEAKRGLFDSARRHTRLAQQTLSHASNSWLEAFAENNSLATAILRSDSDSALLCGTRALRLAEESGVAGLRLSTLGNLGNVLHLLGHFDEAIDYFERALSALPSAGESTNAALDSLARTRLAQGRLDECAALLDRIHESIRSPEDWALYPHRCSLLTRTQLLARQGRLDDALARADSLIELASRAGDHLLTSLAQLARAEVLQQLGRILEALSTLDSVVASLATSPPDLYAQYERILACALAATGHVETGRRHFERAKRVYESIRSAPGLLELSRCWDAANQPSTAGAGSAEVRPHAIEATHTQAPHAKHVLQNAAALMLHASRPDLLAVEIVNLFDETDCVDRVQAVARDKDNQVEILAAVDHLPSAPDAGPAVERRLPVGFFRERHLEVVVRPKPDVESAATVNAVTLLLSAIHDLERARREREEQVTLWPIEEMSIEAGQAVVTGQMRELMSLARRVAQANVSVLITGESGTGKEVLARAIHRFSDRAQKPFIPFNCTAIPRDMLDSQLFGHRRGAFTGADRDNPGLIRAATGGTLFLDEIAELGVDLQPKLLRFLESGEICPLGESTPFTVDVRIVAATNSDVEQYVKDGRLREDLFYRLNVIRLRVPPLRERRDEIPLLVNHFIFRAAAEFKKGEVRFSEETMEHLLLYGWPGNVRQLNNEIRRMVALAEPDATLTPANLSSDIASAKPAARPRATAGEITVSLRDKLAPTLSKIEREMIRTALHEHHGRIDDAAKALGISRKGLYLKRQRLGL